MAKTHAPPAGGYLTPNPSNAYTDRRAAGNVWYVSSAAGTNAAGYGLSPEAPFASIAYAVTQAVANNDDVILVLPGHTETVTAAGGVTVNVAGLTIRGEIAGGTVVGATRSRPVINFTTSASASFLVGAANVCLDNLCFTCDNVASLANPVQVQAAGCVIQNCEFELANSTNQAVLGIQTNAGANRFTCWYNHFHGTNNAGTTAALQVVGGSDIRVEGNYFIGAYGSAVGAIQVTTTDTANCFVYGNTINNLTASCTKAMTFTSGSTGQVSANYLQILSGTAPITGANMSWAGGNSYANALGSATTAI